MLKKLLLLGILLLAITVKSVAQSSDYKLIIFQGSDWCPNCIRFDKKVFTSDEFSNFIKQQNIKTEHIDFPQRIKLNDSVTTYNAQIAEKYNFKGLFPTILLVDLKNSSVTELNFRNQNPEEFIALIQTKLASN